VNDALISMMGYPDRRTALAVRTPDLYVNLEDRERRRYEQVEAACGEAKKLGKRSALHAQSPEGAIMAVRAGCTQVEHGARLSEEAIDMMAKAGIYFDPNNGLLFHTAPCRVAL
jgi:imidazolonepropionase-like amidohydrolase